MGPGARRLVSQAPSPSVNWIGLSAATWEFMKRRGSVMGGHCPHTPCDRGGPGPACVALHCFPFQSLFVKSSKDDGAGTQQVRWSLLSTSGVSTSDELLGTCSGVTRTGKPAPLECGFLTAQVSIYSDRTVASELGKVAQMGQKTKGHVLQAKGSFRRSQPLLTLAKVTFRKVYAGKLTLL